MSSEPQLHEWDERFHALVALHLSEDLLLPTLYKDPILDYNYRHWTTNHVWLHKQPFSLWLIALSLEIFGTSVFAVRIPSLILSALGVFLTYKIGSHLFDNRTGTVAAALHATNGVLLELSSGRISTDHVDAIFVVLVELSIYIVLTLEKEPSWARKTVAGVATGLAVLTKWLTGLLPIAILVYLIFKKHGFNLRRYLSSLYILVVAAMVFLPWQIYTHLEFPLEASWEQNYNTHHLFEALEGHDGRWWFHLNKLRKRSGSHYLLHCC